MPVEYAGKTILELLPKREALLEAMEAGSQTRVGISSGISHDFKGLTYAELKHRMDRVCLALHLLWLEGNPDAPVSDNPYPDPYLNNGKWVTQVF